MREDVDRPPEEEAPVVPDSRLKLAAAHALAGRQAQHAFWGEGAIAGKSMLHQLALRTG